MGWQTFLFCGRIGPLAHETRRFGGRDGLLVNGRLCTRINSTFWLAQTNSSFLNWAVSHWSRLVWFQTPVWLHKTLISGRLWCECVWCIWQTPRLVWNEIATIEELFRILDGVWKGIAWWEPKGRCKLTMVMMNKIGVWWTLSWEGGVDLGDRLVIEGKII